MSHSQRINCSSQFFLLFYSNQVHFAFWQVAHFFPRFAYTQYSWITNKINESFGNVQVSGMKNFHIWSGLRTNAQFIKKSVSFTEIIKLVFFWLSGSFIYSAVFNIVQCSPWSVKNNFFATCGASVSLTFWQLACISVFLLVASNPIQNIYFTFWTDFYFLTKKWNKNSKIHFTFYFGMKNPE